jgi:chemotaxis protein MotB
MSRKGENRGRGVVIRREEGTDESHHGGAWKVAYADFVTAMMAFFLLMWLLNATTEEQRKGLADYFAPANAFSHASSGSGQPFGGKTPLDHGDQVSSEGTVTLRPGVNPPEPDDQDAENDNVAQDPPSRPPDDTRRTQAGTVTDQAAGAASATGEKDTSGTTTRPGMETPDRKASQAELARRERENFEAAARQIQEAVRSDPELSDFARQIAIDQTPEGLRIQLLDEDRRPMFATGSASLADHARLLLRKIAAVLQKLPEGIQISGHTDAAPFKGVGRTNWELSADRANATRRLLAEAGVQEERFRGVTGNADRDPLLPADPMAAANRRMSIVVLRSVLLGTTK